MSSYNTFSVLKPMIKDTYTSKKPKQLKIAKPKKIKPITPGTY